MITSVTFDDTIPYAVDRRLARFDSAEGWVITEPSHGRVTLVHEGHGACVIVQSMPYTLEYTLAEVGRPLTEDERAEHAMALAGGNNNAQLQQQQKRRGRP